MSKNSFFEKNHMFGMPVCSQKCENWYVLCSFMILQYKISQRNLTAIKLGKYYYTYRLHTFLKNVTIIDFLSRPGPNVPYSLHPSFYLAWTTSLFSNPINVSHWMWGLSVIIVQKWEEVIQPIIGTVLHNHQMKISQPRHIPLTGI